MHVLVVGATGFLGTEICRLARERGHAVAGLVRPSSDPERVAALEKMGVRPVRGDLKDAASLAAAVVGKDAVISTATSTRSRQEGDGIDTVDRAGQLDLIAAADDAGVRRYVYVSYTADIDIDDPLTRAKRAVESRLRTSGTTWTILKPSYFMEAWLSPALGFDAANGSVTIFGTGENPISFVSLFDVADLAVRSLDEPATENTDLELGGPEALSPNEVVRICEEEGGSPIAVEYVPVDALRQQAESAADPMERAFGALMLAYARGNVIPTDETARRCGLRLRSVRDYARSLLGAEI